MIKEQAHCPYCNALVSLSSWDAAQPRIHCPRCGESFPNRQETGLTASAPQAAPRSSGIDLRRPEPARLSNAKLGRLILGIMLFMGVVGLAYALVTVNFRREVDLRSKNPPAPVRPDRREPTAPLDLAALGYLPADCRLVGGLHLSQIREQPDGKKLLEELRAKNMNLGLDQIQNWTGLEPEQIDHLAFGIRSGPPMLDFTVVVRTRQPYSQEALAKALLPARPVQFEGKPVYRPQEGPRRMIYRFDEQTIIIYLTLAGVELEALKGLPDQPRTGAAGLAAPIPQIMEKYLKDPDTVLWSAGDLSKIQELPVLLFLAPQVPDPVKALIAGTEEFSIGLRLHEGLTLNANFQGKEVEIAQALQKAFTDRTLSGVKMTVVGPLSDPAPATPKEQRWVLIQMQTSLDRAAEIIADPKTLLP